MLKWCGFLIKYNKTYHEPTKMPTVTEDYQNKNRNTFKYNKLNNRNSNNFAYCKAVIDSH